MMHTWQVLQQHPEKWQHYWLRETVIDAIRSYFKTHGFHEVDTPQLVATPSSEPFLEVFETQLQIGTEASRRAFLTTSPEYAMKKLIAAGSGSIFQICKSYRNGEGRSTQHNSEFTILEWYHAQANYMDVLHDFEGMVGEIARKVTGFLSQADGRQDHRLRPAVDKASGNDEKRSGNDGEGSENDGRITYQGKTYNIASPWEKITVAEAFRRYIGIEVDTLLSHSKLIEVGRQKGYHLTSESTWEQVFHQLLLNEIEPFLGMRSPTVLMDYPADLCPLCRPTASDPRFAERFEVYLAGMELGNAFGELTDAAMLRQNGLADLATRSSLGKTEYGLDEDFIAAVSSGMPPTAGIAVGVDRLVMLFADVSSIQDVLFFPLAEMYED